jgi:hypothetical protein
MTHAIIRMTYQVDDKYKASLRSSSENYFIVDEY